MTSPATECSRGKLENRQLWLNGDSVPKNDADRSGKVTFGAEFAFFCWSAIILR